MSARFVFLCRHHLPRRLVFDGPLPRLHTGKLLRRDLKARYRDQPNAGFSVESASAAAQPRR